MLKDQIARLESQLIPDLTHDGSVAADPSLLRYFVYTQRHRGNRHGDGCLWVGWMWEPPAKSLSRRGAVAPLMALTWTYFASHANTTGVTTTMPCEAK